MIIYNMRNRGPYEYDKFILNILQIHNAVTLSETNELNEFNNENDNLLYIKNNINMLYEKIQGNKKEEGLSEIIYKLSFLTKGGNL